MLLMLWILEGNRHEKWTWGSGRKNAFPYLWWWYSMKDIKQHRKSCMYVGMNNCICFMMVLEQHTAKSKERIRLSCLRRYQNDSMKMKLEWGKIWGERIEVGYFKELWNLAPLLIRLLGMMSKWV